MPNFTTQRVNYSISMQPAACISSVEILSLPGALLFSTFST